MEQVQMLTSTATAESAWLTALALIVVPVALLSELRKSNLPTTSTGVRPACHVQGHTSSQMSIYCLFGTVLHVSSITTMCPAI